MPTYSYRCRAYECAHEWDVVKKISEIDLPEHCSRCEQPGERVLTAAFIGLAAGDWNRVEYNPGLGCWTKSWKHGREIAKSRGLEEIGNESPEKVHRHFDRQREETREMRWRDADREKLYD